MNKKIVSVVLLLLVISLTAYFALASSIFIPTAQLPADQANLSGTTTLNISWPHNATYGQNVVNVTYWWVATTYANLAYNTTTFNKSVNDTDLSNSTFDTSLLQNGIFNLTLVYYNSTGTMNATVGSVITVDNINPLVNISTANHQSFTVSSANQTFNVSVLDNLSSITTIKTLFFEFNNVSYANFNSTKAKNTTGQFHTISFNVSELFAGNHTLKVIAVDFSGNVNQTETIFFEVNTPPNVTVIAGSGRNYSGSGSPFINVSIINATKHRHDSVIGMLDNASGNDFNVSLNPAITRGQYYAGTISAATLIEAKTHVITFFANGTAKNVNRTEFLTFTVDRSGPNITQLTPITIVNTSTNFQAINLSIFDNFTAVDKVVIQLSNGTKPFNVSLTNISGNWNANLNVSTLVDNTAHTLTVFANDTVANMNNSETITIRVDRTKPTVSLINTTMFNTTNKTPYFVFNVSDFSLSTNCSLYINSTFNVSNEAAPNATLFNLTANTLSDGDYLVSANCTDGSGNIGASGSINFTVDTTKPTVNLVNTSFNTTNTTPQFTFNFSDVSTIASCTLALNGTTNMTNASVAVTNNRIFNATTLTEGDYFVSVNCTDNVGNVGNTATTVSLTVDTTAPVMAVTCSPSPATVGDTVSCSCTATEAKGTGILTAAKFLGDDNADESGLASSAGTFESSTCTATDFVGLVGSGSGSTSVNSASSSSGSAGGGGGGGSSSSSSASTESDSDAGADESGSESGSGSSGDSSGSSGSGQSAEDRAKEKASQKKAENAAEKKALAGKAYEFGTILTDLSWLWLTVVIVAVLAGFGYYYWRKKKQ